MTVIKKFTSRILLAASAIALAAPVYAAPAAKKQAANPWIENDAQAAINARTARDFSITPAEAVKQINERYGLKLTEDSLDEYARKHYIEMMDIDGQKRVYRKSVRNLGLLHPALNGGNPPRGANTSDARISYADKAVDMYRTGKSDAAGNKFTYRFSIDVPYDKAYQGDTLYVWMPVPMETRRQKNVTILSASPANYVLSKDIAPKGQNIHNSIFFKAPVVKGKPAHFEYVATYDGLSEYFSPEFIRANIKPYDKNSALYKEYTAQDAPHIMWTGKYSDVAKLAKEIVGDETDPYKQSELVYDYIAKTFPWAGAREYSTIENIPQYVIDERHGDCGQVSMLYITMMRSLGVPARWESGWMLHPGESNYHDWAEVYFEGVGWVPVDASFGRYIDAKCPATQKYYSTGMDAWRLAANKGVGKQFWPAKRYVRSETVDAQAGEVETSKGNLFYPLWNQHLEILSVEPLKRDIGAAGMAKARKVIAETKAKYAPDKRQVLYNVDAVYGPDSSLVISGSTSEKSVKAALVKGLKAAGLIFTDKVTTMPDTLWALPRVSVAHMRMTPGHEGEMASQALMGMPVRLLEQDEDGWWRAQTPDGYIAWIIDNSLALKTPEEMAAWRKAERLVVTAPYQTRAYYTAKGKGLRDVVTDLVNGDIVEGSLSKLTAGRAEITLPDGRKAWVDAKDVTPIEKWADQPFSADKILDQAYSMEGSPYFWGGTSIKNLDCSGLAKVSYLSNGIILMRDASQQALTGKRIEAKDWRTCQPGDLLFFGNAKTGKVTHVAIYDQDGNYVHSSGRVKRNSVDPESPSYLTTPFLHCVRINGMEGTPGITRAINHPWYF